MELKPYTGEYRPGLEEVKSEVKALTDVICYTEAYRTYIKSLDKLKMDERLYGRLNEYRRKALFMGVKEEDMGDVADTLYNEYRDILCDPQVMDFLAREASVNKLMRSVYDCIANEVYIDISYME